MTIPADQLKTMRTLVGQLPSEFSSVVRDLLDHIDVVTKDRDDWKRRAVCHGCDPERGDQDCG